VKDADGNTLPGRSKKAGLLALTQTAISRCVTSFVVLTVPPVLLARADKTEFIKRNPRLVMPLNLCMYTASLPTSQKYSPHNEHALCGSPSSHRSLSAECRYFGSKAGARIPQSEG
jgi:hypothetical protein